MFWMYTLRINRVFIILQIGKSARPRPPKMDRSDEIDVDGIDHDGNSIPVFRKGEWAN